MPTIIAEGDEVLAIDKPAGLITHSDGRTIEPSLAEWLAERYPRLASVGEPWVSPQGELVRVSGLVHRLDRATSGVLLTAKNNAVFAELRQAFRDRLVDKRYRALVAGWPTAERGTVVAELVRSSERPKRWYARPTDIDDRRAAITEWRVLERAKLGGEKIAYLELAPRTGRTHQLRVHLASIGHPLLGDTLYGIDDPSQVPFDRLALHALSIRVPLSGRSEVFTAPTPVAFEQLFPRV